jgi:hypothetical protein
VEEGGGLVIVRLARTLLVTPHDESLLPGEALLIVLAVADKMNV